MQACPCGSPSYSDCCAPFLEQREYPPDPVALMRARYSAHVHVNIDFLQQSYHPEKRDEINWQATRNWAERSEWLGLQIGELSAQEDTAELELIADYREGNGRRQRHHEISVFQRHEGRWYFFDARMPQIQSVQREAPKQSRNAPCQCGSGRKYKHCCGKRS